MLHNLSGSGLYSKGTVVNYNLPFVAYISVRRDT